MEAGNRTPLNGYKVVFVPFSGGRPSGPAQECRYRLFSMQTITHMEGRSAWLSIGPADLLIADDVGNTVWRVSSASPRFRCRQ